LAFHFTDQEVFFFFFYSDVYPKYDTLPQKKVEEFKAKGIEVIQSGKFDEDEHYYLDTEKFYGILIEIGNNGSMRPPERVFPA